MRGIAGFFVGFKVGLAAGGVFWSLSYVPHDALIVKTVIEHDAIVLAVTVILEVDAVEMTVTGVTMVLQINMVEIPVGGSS